MPATLNTGFSCEYFKSFRNNFFYRATPVAAFELYFSIRKIFSKIKFLERLLLLLLVCFRYNYKSLKAGQLPRDNLSFLQNLLNFIITKYLKKEFDDDLSVSVDERSPYGLSVGGDIKIYHCHVIKR